MGSSPWTNFAGVTSALGNQGGAVFNFAFIALGMLFLTVGARHCLLSCKPCLHQMFNFAKAHLGNIIHEVVISAQQLAAGEILKGSPTDGTSQVVSHSINTDAPIASSKVDKDKVKEQKIVVVAHRIQPSQPLTDDADHLVKLRETVITQCNVYLVKLVDRPGLYGSYISSKIEVRGTTFRLFVDKSIIILNAESVNNAQPFSGYITVIGLGRDDSKEQEVSAACFWNKSAKLIKPAVKLFGKPDCIYNIPSEILLTIEML